MPSHCQMRSQTMQMSGSSISNVTSVTSTRKNLLSVWIYGILQDSIILYYASHPVFFSLRAIYVLVYNLSKSLNAEAEPCARQGTYDKILENPNSETNVETLLSWLVTVHNITRMREETVTVDSAQRKLPNYLRPPVFIVGTHADKPVEDIATMKSQIWRKMSHKGYAKHVVQPFFSIDNTVRSLQNESGFHEKERNIGKV